MAIYYTLRMTLVFEVPEILSMAHEWYKSTEEYLKANQTIEWAISLSLIAIDMAIIFKSGMQEHFPLIIGLISGLCGLEDMTAIILISMVGKMILRLEEGVEVGREYKKSVQQAGKVYKL